MANEFKIRKGLIVEGASGGTVVNVLGSQGQLLSVTDDLSGSIFAVSDISGVPIFNVNSSGLSTFDGSLNVTNSADTVAKFNRLSDDGEIIRFQQDTSIDGAINSLSGRIAIGSGNTGIFFDSIRQVVTPHNMTTNGNEFNNISFGRSLIRFKDIYLSGKIAAGTGSTAAATINAYTTTVSTGLHSALRILENTGASSYWDIGATNGTSTLLNFYHNANTSPKISFTHTGGAIFAGNVGIGVTTPTGNLSMNSQIGNGTSPPTSYTTNTTATRYQSFFNSYYTSATDGLGPYPRYFDMVATGSPDGTNGGSNIRFLTTGVVAATGAVERMRITSAGNSFFNYPNPTIQTYGSGAYGGKVVIKASDDQALTLLNSSIGGTAHVALNFTNEFVANQYNYLARIKAEPETVWDGTASNRSSRLTFSTNNVGTIAEKMRITAAGGISFGATGTAYGTSGQVLTSAGNASPTWQDNGSGDISGSGTANYVTKFTGTKTIGNGPIVFSSNSFELLQSGTFMNANHALYNGTSSGGTGTTAVQYIKIFEKDGNSNQQYLHFSLLSFSNSEYSAEVKIIIPAYSGFSSSYGTMDAGQGVQVEIVYGGLSTQTSSILSIIECADLSSTSTNTTLYLKIQPVATTTQVILKDYGDCTERVLINQTWSTTAPSDQHREFTFNVGATNINQVLSIHRDQKVGIGTTDPGALLEISGIRENQIRLTSRDITAAIDETIGGIEFYSSDSGNEGVKASISAIATDAAGNAYMTFNTGTNVERMRISSAGNVNITSGNLAIGKTTVPAQRLDVAGNVVIPYANGYLMDTTGAGGSNFVKTINDYETVVGTDRGSAGFGVFGNSNIRLGFGTSYTAAQTKLIILSDGNVGIGNSDPQADLVISNAAGGTGGVNLEIQPISTGVVQSYINRSASPAVYIKNEQRALTHEWDINLTTKLTLNSTGLIAANNIDASSYSGPGEGLDNLLSLGAYDGSPSVGILIATNIVTNNYGFIFGTIKIEQFNFTSKQTIEFSATVNSNGTLITKDATSDVAITFKLFNYSGKWYLWFPMPSTYSTCTAFVNTGAGYQGQSKGFNEVASVSVGAVPGSGVTNSYDITPKVYLTTATPGGNLPGGPYLPLTGGTVSGPAATGAYLVTIENTSSSTATSYGLLVKGGGGSASGKTFEVQDSSGNSDFIVKGNGEIGIGITTPGTLHGAAYGTTKLHIDGGTDRGQLIIEGDSFAGIVLSDNGATANQRVFATSVDEGKYSIKPLNDNGTSTAGGVAVTVLHGGNVGIGVTSPDTKTHIQGASAVTGAFYDSSTVLTVEDINPYIQIIGTDGGNQASSLILTNVPAAGTGDNKNWAVQHRGTTQNGNFGISYDTTSASGQDSADGTDLFVIETTGNVGIGNTSPRDKLTVFTAGTAEEEIALRLVNPIGFTNAGSGASIIFAQDRSVGENLPMAKIRSAQSIGGTSSYGDLIFSTLSSTMQDRMTILSGGNVGIGTTGPAYKFDVDETTSGNLTVARFKHNQSTVTSNIILENAAGGDNSGFNVNFKTGSSGYGGALGVIRTNSPNAGDADMFLSSGGGEAIRILSNGNVGIGTSTPLAKLDIQGTQGQLFSVTDDLSGSIFAVADISGVPIFDVNSSGVSYFDGNVGIGTDDPQANLEVATPMATAYGTIRLRGPGGGRVDFRNATYPVGQIRSNATGDMTFFTGDGTNGSTSSKVTILSGGNVGIGTTSPSSHKLDVDGAIRGNQYNFDGNANNPAGTTASIYDQASVGLTLSAHNVSIRNYNNSTSAMMESARFINTSLTVAGDVIAYGSPSDVRLKENIKPIESALDKAMKLQGVTFDWKQKEDSILELKEDIGFIAQDVKEVVPELVRENEDGMLSMRHQGIAPILLEAIKELKAEIDLLKSRPCTCNKCNCNI